MADKKKKGEKVIYVLAGDDSDQFFTLDELSDSANDDYGFEDGAKFDEYKLVGTKTLRLSKITLE